MEQQLDLKSISPKALTVWRIHGTITVAITSLIFIALIVLTFIFHWPKWLIAIWIAVPIIEAYIFIYLIPKLRWRRWKYAVREQEIELQHGVLVQKRTLIPMVRVQHVDTEQGPILRKYQLASISISSAATNHQIPALPMNEADELRGRISAWARVAEDDV